MLDYLTVVHDMRAKKSHCAWRIEAPQISEHVGRREGMLMGRTRGVERKMLRPISLKECLA